MSAVSRLGCALAGATAASVGDLALLWVGWAADARFGLPVPPAAVLLAGHYLGVLGIPLYALYRALADDLRASAPRAAHWVAALGAVGSVLGAVVHGLTGALTHVALRTGGATAPDAMLALPEAAFLLPLWLIVGIALGLGSLVFAVTVGRGGTALPRPLAACAPAFVTIAIAAGATPLPRLAAFLVPAAPNLAHVVLFGAALAVAARRSAPAGLRGPRASRG